MSKHNNAFFLPDSVTRFLMVLVKLAIVIGTGYYIYQKLIYNDTLDIHVFLDTLYTNNIISPEPIVLLLGFTALNWFVESVKWQQLVKAFSAISIWNAIVQTLGSLTASIATPNRIGEYGAKAIYYRKGLRKKILGLTLISNLSQLVITCLFGITGVFLFIKNYNPPIAYETLLTAIILLLSVGYFTIAYHKKNPFSFKGYSWDKFKNFVLNLPKRIIGTTFALALLRYLIFSHQFYYLVVLFGIDINYIDAMSLITCMYILASIIPTIFIFDVVVKGSISVWLFSFAGANEFLILCITTLMWILNFALPAAFGSYFVLNFDTNNLIRSSKTTENNND